MAQEILQQIFNNTSALLAYDRFDMGMQRAQKNSPPTFVAYRPGILVVYGGRI